MNESIEIIRKAKEVLATPKEQRYDLFAKKEIETQLPVGDCSLSLIAFTTTDKRIDFCRRYLIKHLQTHEVEKTLLTKLEDAIFNHDFFLFVNLFRADKDFNHYDFNVQISKI